MRVRGADGGSSTEESIDEKATMVLAAKSRAAGSKGPALARDDVDAVKRAASAKPLAQARGRSTSRGRAADPPRSALSRGRPPLRAAGSAPPALARGRSVTIQRGRKATKKGEADGGKDEDDEVQGKDKAVVEAKKGRGRGAEGAGRGGRRGGANDTGRQARSVGRPPKVGVDDVNYDANRPAGFGPGPCADGRRSDHQRTGDAPHWDTGTEAGEDLLRRIDTGDWIEGKLYSPGGASLGHAVWEVVAAHPLTPDGLFLEVTFRGAESAGVARWWRSTHQAIPDPLVHLCRTEVNSCTCKRLGSREAMHVDEFRVWEYKPPHAWVLPGDADSRVAPGRQSGPADLADKVNILKGRLHDAGYGQRPVDDLPERVRGFEEKGDDRHRRDRRGRPGLPTPPRQEPGDIGQRPWPPLPDDDGWRPREAHRHDVLREDPRAAAAGERGHRQGRQLHGRNCESRERSQRGERIADVLAGRVAEHRVRDGGRDERARIRRRSRAPSRSGSRRHDRRRSRHKRRRRVSSSSEPEEQGFREARGTLSSNPSRTTAERAPGRLLESCLTRIQGYLGRRQGSREADTVAAVFTPYLTSVLMPTFGDSASMRNSHELANLATALDYLMLGDVTKACDVLAQRFKAVELATQDGHWHVAKHVQLVGESRVSTLSQREREVAALQEKHENKFKAMGGGRTPG